MIPVRDNVPKSTKTFACYGLIGLIVVNFVWELQLESKGELSKLIDWVSLKPALISQVLQDLMSSGNPAALFFLVFSLFSVLTTLFFQASFGQLIGNLLFLWVFGRTVECVLGTPKFLLIFLGWGSLTGLFQVVLDPSLTIPILGANSAIAAIFGAYLGRYPFAKVEAILPLLVVFIPITLPAWFFLMVWFGKQFFYTFGSLEMMGDVNRWSLGYWSHGIGILLGMIASRRMSHS